MSKKIDDLKQKLDKDIGKGTLMYANEKPNQNYESYSTGSLSLDSAMGVGGFPKGRIIEVYGNYSVGKTLLMLNAIKSCQDKGQVAAFIDIENAVDLEWAQKLGVNTKTLLFSQPNSGEEALTVMEELIDSGEVNLIVIDSVAALIPKAEIEGEFGDRAMGSQARLMGQAMRKLSPKINKMNVCTIWANQIRQNIGNPYEPIVTTGGNALKFFADIRISLNRGTQDKNGEIVLGNEIRGKIIKNKCASPFRSFSYDIVYGIGIHKIGEIVDIATDLGIIKKAGSWMSYKDIKIQGRDSMVALLTDNDELKDEIELLVKEQLHL